jgi:hypothetical protein
MANWKDESGTNILDESGAVIADEAGPEGGASPSVGLQSLSFTLNSITVDTGSGLTVQVNKLNLSLAVKDIGGFDTVVSVSALSRYIAGN